MRFSGDTDADDVVVVVVVDDATLNTVRSRSVTRARTHAGLITLSGDGISERSRNLLANEKLADGFHEWMAVRCDVHMPMRSRHATTC